MKSNAIQLAVYSRSNSYELIIRNTILSIVIRFNGNQDSAVYLRTHIREDAEEL